MRNVYIGIDNGVSGSIGMIFTVKEPSIFLPTPVKLQQNYQKTKKNINRVDIPEFKKIINKNMAMPSLAILERPMVNPGMFNASISAVRCFEAQLCILEHFNIPYMFIDSKQWQKELLPQGIKGKAELKKASHDIGIRLFPEFKDIIAKQKDADGLLIAEWARRNNL